MFLSVYDNGEIHVIGVRLHFEVTRFLWIVQKHLLHHHTSIVQVCHACLLLAF